MECSAQRCDQRQLLVNSNRETKRGGRSGGTGREREKHIPVLLYSLSQDHKKNKKTGSFGECYTGRFYSGLRPYPKLIPSSLSKSRSGRARMVSLWALGGVDLASGGGRGQVVSEGRFCLTADSDRGRLNGCLTAPKVPRSLLTCVGCISMS